MATLLKKLVIPETIDLGSSSSNLNVSFSVEVEAGSVARDKSGNPVTFQILLDKPLMASGAAIYDSSNQPYKTSHNLNNAPYTKIFTIGKEDDPYYVRSVTDEYITLLNLKKNGTTDIKNGSIDMQEWVPEDFYKKIVFNNPQTKLPEKYQYDLGMGSKDVWTDSTPNTATEIRKLDYMQPDNKYTIQEIRFRQSGGFDVVYNTDQLKEMGFNTTFKTVGGSYLIRNTDNTINQRGTFSNDNLTGFVFNDTLDGGEGNDVIQGNLGTDILTGGKGQDKFVYSDIKHAPISTTGIETITDFTAYTATGLALGKKYTEDKIDLSKIDADTNARGDQAFSKPVVGTTFSGAFKKAGELFFESNSGILYGNVNADGAPDFAIKLSGVSSITADNLAL